MKNITIGHVNSDWIVASSAHYYAERGNGEDSAFGETPVEALTKLMQREAAKAARFDMSLCEEVAFLALGAADLLRERRGANLDGLGGFIGLITEVIRCAPMLQRRLNQVDISKFNGVWLYDITERFGHEWAEVLLNGGDESPEYRLECILADEMDK